MCFWKRNTPILISASSVLLHYAVVVPSPLSPCRLCMSLPMHFAPDVVRIYLNVIGKQPKFT